MNNSFLKCILRSGVGKTPVQRILLPGLLVHFIVEVDGEAMFAGTAALCDAGTLGQTLSRRRLYDHDLPSTEESDRVVIRAPKTENQCKVPLPLPSQHGRRSA